MRIPDTDAAPGARLLLSKAMFAGVHTDLYEVADLAVMSGRTASIQWMRDDLPDPYADTVLVWRAGFRLLEEHWGLRSFEGVRCDGDVITPRVEDLGPGREGDL